MPLPEWGAAPRGTPQPRPSPLGTKYDPFPYAQSVTALRRDKIKTQEDAPVDTEAGVVAHPLDRLETGLAEPKVDNLRFHVCQQFCVGSTKYMYLVHIDIYIYNIEHQLGGGDKRAYRIGIAVAHQDGRVLVELGLGHQVGEPEAQDQVGGHGDDAGELDRGGEAGEDAHGSALAEARERDALRRDAVVNLLLDQRVDVLLAPHDTRLVLVPPHGVLVGTELGLGACVQARVSVIWVWPV